MLKDQQTELQIKEAELKNEILESLLPIIQKYGKDYIVCDRPSVASINNSEGFSLEEDFSSFANVKYDMSVFLDMDAIDKYAIDRQEFLKYFGLTEVKESPVWSCGGRA